MRMKSENAIGRPRRPESKVNHKSGDLPYAVRLYLRREDESILETVTRTLGVYFFAKNKLERMN